MVYKWYILPIGGLYATYHLLGEPETTIEESKKKHQGSAFAMEFSVQDKDPDHLNHAVSYGYLTFLLANSRLPSYPLSLKDRPPLRNL